MARHAKSKKQFISEICFFSLQNVSCFPVPVAAFLVASFLQRNRQTSGRQGFSEDTFKLACKPLGGRVFKSQVNYTLRRANYISWRHRFELQQKSYQMERVESSKRKRRRSSHSSGIGVPIGSQRLSNSPRGSSLLYGSQSSDHQQVSRGTNDSPLSSVGERRSQPSIERGSEDVCNSTEREEDQDGRDHLEIGGEDVGSLMNADIGTELGSLRSFGAKGKALVEKSGGHAFKEFDAELSSREGPSGK